jgi:hypothetical protein
MFFATLDTTSQLIGMAAPIVMVQWMRYLVQTLSSAALIAHSGELKTLRITKPALHITRGLMMLTTTVLGFTAALAAGRRRICWRAGDHSPVFSGV